MKRKNNQTYSAYAHVYDAFKGDRSANIEMLESLIRTHHITAADLLDLACGTGSIAQGLGGNFTISGVDSSPDMLRLARKKMPDMLLQQADMTTFALEQQFDLVYCLHNSVNHLLTFDAWRAMFARVAEHLRSGGVFIFDSNPPEKLAQMVEYGPGVIHAGEDYVVTHIASNSTFPDRYDWHVKVFLHGRRNAFTLHHEVIQVASYPHQKIVTALEEHFTLKETFTLEHANMHDDIGRTYYVCVKSAA